MKSWIPLVNLKVTWVKSNTKSLILKEEDKIISNEPFDIKVLSKIKVKRAWRQQSSHFECLA